MNPEILLVLETNVEFAGCEPDPNLFLVVNPDVETARIEIQLDLVVIESALTGVEQLLGEFAPNGCRQTVQFFDDFVETMPR